MLAQILVDGELDAIYSPARPLRYNAANDPIVRLLPDYKPVEQAYFGADGVLPPHHLVVLRREVWEADWSLAHRVTDVFVRCQAAYMASLRGFPCASPFFEQELDEVAAMGANPYAHGLEENRIAMEEFAGMAHRLGLTSRLIPVDEYFAYYRAF